VANHDYIARDSRVTLNALSRGWRRQSSLSKASCGAGALCQRALISRAERAGVGASPPAWRSAAARRSGTGRARGRRGDRPGDTEIFRGTLHRADVEPRGILKECLLRGAAGVVIFHTHPSGDPTPSDADMQFTRRMAYAAALVGIDLVDHLVHGVIGRWVSLKAQEGW
jgi:hypothetical protein